MRVNTKLCLQLALFAAAASFGQAPTARAQQTPAPEAGAPDAAAPVAATAGTVVATVNGTELTIGHMLALREKLPAEYQSLPDDVLFKGILDQLVQQTALAQSHEAAISPRDLLNIDNDRRAYLAGAAVDAVAGQAVTDAALQAAYDARYASAAPSTEYKAAHILVTTEEEAKAIKSAVDNGADFAQQAMEKSTDGAAANGGDLGWFGQGMMVKEFEDAVIRMQPGTVSDPVKTQFGWHVIQLSETRIAAAPALDTVRDEITAELQQKAVVDHITALTAAATVTRTAEGIDPTVLRDQTLLQR